MAEKPTYEELEQRVLELEKADSDRKQAEKALQESEAKYRRIADNSPAILYQFFISPDGIFSFLYVSDVVMAIMGIPPEEIMQDSSKIFDMVHPDDQEMFWEAMKKSAETLESFPLTFRYMKGGEVIWLEARGAPTPLTDGGILWDGFLLDITRRKQTEEQRDKLIEELEKALSEVKTLKGIFPICASCKKIRDDKGYWNQIESYIRYHTEAEFSHGICPDCAKKLYPDFDLYKSTS